MCTSTSCRAAFYCDFATDPHSASLHIKLYAVELGDVEVDEPAGDVAVVCLKCLARRHVGDNLALDNALLVAFGGRGLDGDG